MIKALCLVLPTQYREFAVVSNTAHIEKANIYLNRYLPLYCFDIAKIVIKTIPQHSSSSFGQLPLVVPLFQVENKPLLLKFLLAYLNYQLTSSAQLSSCGCSVAVVGIISPIAPPPIPPNSFLKSFFAIVSIFIVFYIYRFIDFYTLSLFSISSAKAVSSFAPLLSGEQAVIYSLQVGASAIAIFSLTLAIKIKSLYVSLAISSTCLLRLRPFQRVKNIPPISILLFSQCFTCAITFSKLTNPL